MRVARYDTPATCLASWSLRARRFAYAWPHALRPPAGIEVIPDELAVL